ncbi:Hypothetical predicted protein [Paramuricea clavata]|uniref:Uncharacterized protein n=1 Tax=Paramuricea clavata TaxID=317549 RepID=A0A6S7K7E2_PARCT|nr:Hypothetical predicted protein [Paramuricea clavata]
MVPFLVTNDSLEYPILGYNVIEELIKPMNTSDIQSAHIATVQASFQGFDEKALLELVRLIQSARANELCTIKSPKNDFVIPAKKTFKVNCRANTGPVEETTLVLFEPDELTTWPNGLSVHQTVTTVKQGSTSQVKIDVTNTTNHDIVVRKYTVLGSLQLIKSIIPVRSEVGRKVTQRKTTNSNSHTIPSEFNGERNSRTRQYK